MIKNKLGIKFQSEPIHEKKYLKAKIRELDSKIKPNFLGNGVPKEYIHYTCIACITIDSVLKIDKKKVIRKFIQKSVNMQMSRFTNAELNSDSDLDSHLDPEVESKSDTELMAIL